MKKAKRNLILGIVFSVLIISLLGAGYFFVVYNPSGQSILITSGCQLIKNPSDPTSAYTKILDSVSTGGLSYTCSGNKECVVSGSMNIEKGISSGTNIVQCNSSTCISPKTFSTIAECQGTPNRCGSGTCSSQNCKFISSSEPIYSAKFNFCPSGSTFDYCSGIKNDITVKQAQVVSTDEVKLNGLATQSLTFTPKYSDNTEVLKKSIYIKEYDCSCIPLVSSTPQTYCSSDTTKVYCTSGCPTGSTFKTSIYCQKLNGISSYKTLPNVCADNNGYCFTPQYNAYKTCSGTQDVQGSKCSIWSGSNTCPTNQQCIVTATGKAGEGIGGCKCSTDSCVLGSIKPDPNNAPRGYLKCVTGTSGCNTEVSDTCTEGLIFDSTLSKCVCDTSNTCDSQNKECIGSTQIRSCYLKNIAEKLCTNGACQCYNWNTNPTSCSSGQLCKSIINSPDYCSCEGVSKCSIGQIKCKDTVNYLECSQVPSDPNSCLDYRDLGGKVDSSSFICDSTSNSIMPRTDIGCAYNTVGYECSKSVDTNNVKVESCDNSLNKCIVISDENSASASDFTKTRCSISNANLVQKVTKYTGRSGDIYRWETKTDAQYSSSGVCNSDFRCISGACVSNNEFMIITAKYSYAVGENIDNITIQMTNKVPNLASGKGSVIKLVDSDGNIVKDSLNRPIEIRGKTVNAEGKIPNINLDYSHGLVEDLTLEVLVDPDNSNDGYIGNKYTGSKKIVIAKNLIVKPTCPSIAIVGREITCTWKVVDSKTNNLVTQSLSTELRISQGTSLITDYSSTSSSVSFVPQKTGSVKLTINASATDYLPGSSSISIPVNSPTISQLLLVDNKDYGESAGSGFSTGIHQFSLNIEESGQPVEVSYIEAKIFTPSGKEDNLIFNQNAQGLWVTSYNLLQAGQSYTLSGNIIPLDPSKQPLPFEYSLSTVGSSTQDLSTLYITIGIIVGIVLLIAIILGVMIFKFKKKR